LYAAEVQDCCCGGTKEGEEVYRDHFCSVSLCPVFPTFVGFG
jgi:hypothetical protein